jgi:predicted metal-dependent peptidase
MELTAKEILTKARIQLQKDEPFFSYISLHLKFVKDDKMPMPTIGVDKHGNLHYNEKFVKSLTLEEAKSTLCHEILHLVLDHFGRQGKRNSFISNIAKDIVVNNILINKGFSLNKSGIIPENNSYVIPGTNYEVKDIDKKIWEEIYSEIENLFNKNNNNNLKPDDNILNDDCSNCRGKIDSEIKKEKQKIKNWKRIAVEAASLQRMRGNVSSVMERFIDGILQSKIDWKKKLYKYILRELPYDYSYSYPSKKSISTGIYMPHVTKETIDICSSIDTSGSVSDKEIKKYLSELIKISKMFNNIRVTIIICDCNIQGTYEINNGNIDKIMNIKIKGGGGTSHIPVYEWIKKNKPNTRLLIAFTDGYTNYPDKEEIKTIWVLNKYKKMKWGEVIVI